MSCLFCKNFHAMEPPEHERQREAGACQSFCGNRWDAYTAARYVKRHKRFLKGVCLFSPKPEETDCRWVCSKFEDGFYPSWHIGQPGERENIWDWAEEKMRTHMNGDYNEQERDRLREDNAQLKHALQASRKRSAARLARLNKRVKKEPVQPKPAVLRLVAAE